jgi:hypothetical protein
MEAKMLEKLGGLAGPGAEPAVVDMRASLATNPDVEQWRIRSAEDLKGMAWHQALSWGSVEAVARYHTGPDSHLRGGGVASIAYTWAIRKNGQIVLCNDFEKKVWSQGYRDREGDENAEFMSIMFEGFFRGKGVGDPSASEPTTEQLAAGLGLWTACKESWGWNDDDLYGHYHFGKPACPGNTLQANIEAIRFHTEKIVFDLDTVRGRQEALKALGYYADAPDGIWGPVSKGALVRFQSKKKLVADGIWGLKTEAAIIKALRNQTMV